MHDVAVNNLSLAFWEAKMNEDLYKKEIECPVCLEKFYVTKVKSKACRVQSRDTDFCVYYKGINPIFYDAWVCENCGYASLSDKFSEISNKDAKIIKENISGKWVKRSMEGERNLEAALEAFKLVLYNYQVRGAKASEMAKVCLRIAWLYRLKNDPKENDFLEHALNYYIETYEKEKFPADKLDENTCIYMIGELSLRTGKYEEAVKWFSRLITSRDTKPNSALKEMARDRYQLVKDKLTNTGS